MENITTSDYVIENIVFVEPTDSVFKVYEMMKRDQIRHLPVVQGGKAVGIISDRDLQFVTLAGNDQLTCKDIMTEEPLTFKVGTPVANIANVMSKKKISSALINNDQGKVVGIFTSTDALNILGSFEKDEE